MSCRYRATLYPCPESRQERRETLTSIDGRIHDLNQVLHETYIHSQEQLGRLGNDLETWNIQVRTLNTTAVTAILSHITA